MRATSSMPGSLCSQQGKEQTLLAASKIVVLAIVHLQHTVQEFTGHSGGVGGEPKVTRAHPDGSPVS